MKAEPQRNLHRPVWGSRRFLREYGDLTDEQQRRARKAFVLWRIGLFPKGLNCEKCHAPDGHRYWTLRGTRKVRLFFVETDGGAVFFATNFHDYDIAKGLDFDAISPEESLASWDPSPDAEAAARKTADEDFGEDDDPDLLPGTFPLSSPEMVPDQKLIDLGVLWEFIPDVRSLRDGDELLDLLARHGDALPEKELMCLFDAPRRSTVERLLLARARNGLLKRGEDVDGGRPEALDYWRAASLERFRLWFSPDQSDAVVADSPGPMAVLGAAGTGKTVVALHRARYLAFGPFRNPGDRILLTSFSRTLAQDLEKQLDEICRDAPDVRARIDVRNLDDALVAFLRANGVDMDLDFERYDGRAEMLMKRAARTAGYAGERRPGWLWQEYSSAIGAMDVRRESDYVGRLLPGPETKPDDAEKKKLWPVFRRFESICEEAGFWTVGRAANKAVRMLTPGGGARPETRYAAAVVDETQDMSRERLRFLSALVGYDPAAPRPNILTFFGDARQRIFDHGANLDSCGIAVCSERTLVRNYRSTEEIRLRAERFLEGVPMDDLDGDLVVRDPSPAARKGVPVEESRCGNDEEECALVAETIRRWIDEDSRQPGSPGRRPGEYAVLSPSRDRVRLIQAGLERLGLPAIVVTAAKPPDDRGQVRVMTLHRAKGLEFQGVALDLDADNWPMTRHAAGTLPPKEKRRRENRAKRLAYVGLTRAIRRALITGVGPAPEGM